MNRKEIISVNQLLTIFYISIVSTGLITLPHPMYLKAQQNMWISIIMSSTMGFLAVFICYFFKKNFPDKNFNQIIYLAVGNRIGYLINCIIFILYSFDMIYFLKEYELYLTDLFYQFMSPSLIIGLMLLVSMYAVVSGLEVIARCAQIIWPTTIILTLGIFVLLLPDIDFKNMFPIFEYGFGQPIKASFIAMAWFSELFWMIFFVQDISESAKKLKVMGFIYVFIIMISLFLFFITVLGVLGNYTGHTLYPVSLAERYIQMGTFIERTSVFFMAIWVLGVFIKIASLLFILTRCFCEVLHASSIGLISSVLCVVYFILSLILIKSTSSLFQVGFPLFLIVTYVANFGIFTMIFCITLFKKRTKIV